VLFENGCAVRVNARRYYLWEWSVLPWLLASPGFVVCEIGHVFERWRSLMDRSVLPRCLESPVIVVSGISGEWRDSER
jgi:hypothetical protein